MKRSLALAPFVLAVAVLTACSPTSADTADEPKTAASTAAEQSAAPEESEAAPEPTTGCEQRILDKYAEMPESYSGTITEVTMDDATAFYGFRLPGEPTCLVHRAFSDGTSDQFDVWYTGTDPDSRRGIITELVNSGVAFQAEYTNPIEESDTANYPFTREGNPTIGGTAQWGTSGASFPDTIYLSAYHYQ